jgi:hypothetical protein
MNKNRFILSVVVLLTLQLNISSSFAQQYDDVIYLINGGVRRGLLFEVIPGESVKLKTNYGEIFVIQMSEISKIVREGQVESGPLYKVAKDSKNDVESWYVYFGMGYANVGYTDELNDFFVDRNRVVDQSRLSMGMDLPGVYFPLNDQRTIVGFAFNASVDIYSSKYDSDSYIAATSGQWSVSAIHFTQALIGEGPFLRTDLGWGKFSLEDDDGVKPLQGYEVSGPSVLAGVGYGIPIRGGGTRILLNVNYAMRPGVEINYGDIRKSGSVRAFSFTVGGLF